VLDLALTLAIPGMTVFTPSSAQELKVMLRDALELDGPAVVRYARGAARQVDPSDVGSGLTSRKLRDGDGVCLLAVGKMVEAALEAAEKLDAEGVHASVWDVRVVKPLDVAMLEDALRHRLVVTIEDGIRVGGAGTAMADALARMQPSAPAVVVLGTPVEYIPHGEAAQIHAALGLDGGGIAATVLDALAGSHAPLA
jgi:1-deoxy-D-xylulose-5-phosphate synthase